MVTVSRLAATAFEAVVTVYRVQLTLISPLLDRGAHPFCSLPLPSCNGDLPLLSGPRFSVYLRKTASRRDKFRTPTHSRIQARPLLVSSNPQLQARYSNSTALGLISAGKRILRVGKLARKLRGRWIEKRELIASGTRLPCDNDYKFVSFVTPCSLLRSPVILQSFDPFLFL